MNDDRVSQGEQLASQHPHSEASQSTHRRTSSSNTERPPSAQQSHDDANDQTEEITAEEGDEEESDPADKIPDFDWNNLIERYHTATNKCTDEEAHLMQEWSNLMEV
jgi:hypothetical protein